MPFRILLDQDGSPKVLSLSEGEMSLGSAEDSDLRLTDPTVSRRHALIRVEGDRVEVEDLGSRNGTRVRGKTVEATVPVSAGDKVTFGTVEGRLEAVTDEDLVPAVRFETPLEPEAAESGEIRTPTTASVGSLQRFPLDHLPRWLDCLEDRCSLVGTAQVVGAGLFEALPCQHVEIESSEEGILFQAKREIEGAPATVPVEIGDSGGSVAVDFLLASQAQGFRPVVESAARFLALVDRRRPPRTPSPRPTAPKPPDPPTVVPRVREIYEDAARVARGEVSVVITGESGTGKELLARYLHEASPRREEPFVALNCAALPRDLLEAELFGIEKGVATGVRSRAGKFELADGGTLFLDEIGDMAFETQAKILRVLQEGEVYRVGGQEPRQARVRVVAATNRNLDELREEGRFRQDLYHRIADWRVDIPSLRERRADIPNLAAHFLQREVQKAGIQVAGISRGAMKILQSCPWPGNVRQLEREMARAALFVEDGELLQSSHLQESLKEGGDTVLRERGGTLKQRLERWERMEIAQAIEQHEGNLSAVARALDIGRSTLYRRMKELAMED